MKIFLTAIVILSCLLLLPACMDMGTRIRNDASQNSILPPLSWPTNDREVREHSARFKKYVVGNVGGFIWWQEDGGGMPAHGRDGGLICSAKIRDRVFRQILKRHPWLQQPVPQDVARTMHMPLEVVSQYAEHYVLNVEGRKMSMTWLRATGNNLLVITLYYPDLKMNPRANQ